MHYGVCNDEGEKERIAVHLTAVSPAGSVGASALQRCPPDTRTFAMTGYLTFSAYAIYWHIPYLYTVKVSKGKFVPLVIREGPETQLKGCPAALFPISVRTEIGCPRGTRAKGFYSFEKEKRIATRLTVFAMTKLLDILNA